MTRAVDDLLRDLANGDSGKSGVYVYGRDPQAILDAWSAKLVTVFTRSMIGGRTFFRRAPFSIPLVTHAARAQRKDGKQAEYLRVRLTRTGFAAALADRRRQPRASDLPPEKQGPPDDWRVFVAVVETLDRPGRGHDPVTVDEVENLVRVEERTIERVLSVRLPARRWVTWVKLTPDERARRKGRLPDSSRRLMGCSLNLTDAAGIAAAEAARKALTRGLVRDRSSDDRFARTVGRPTTSNRNRP